MKSGLHLVSSRICWSFTQGISPPEREGGESDEADNCISVEEFSAWVEDIKQSASAEDRGGEDSSTEADFMWFFNQMSGGDECISREDLLNSMGAIEVCLEAMKQNNP